MVKKFIVMAMVLVMTAGFSAMVFAEEGAAPVVSVGGHIKMTLFDRVNAISETGGNTYVWNRTFGITFKEVNLYINAKINDWLSFEADPKLSMSTGATPSIGKTGPGAEKAFSFTSMGHGKAVMMVELPWDVHMEIGQIHPTFSAEYGQYLFWEEEQNVGPFVGSHGPAGAFHDNGIELIKTFSITDEFSLPVYLYYLNGMGAVDPNNTPGVMLHIEPTYGPLKILASAYAMKADAAERLAQHAWLVGLHFKWEGLEIRAEGAKGVLEDGIAAGIDEFEEGYFVKVIYKVLPMLKVFASHESDLVLQDIRKFRYEVGSVIYLSDATMLQLAVDVQEQRMNDFSEAIVWTRPSIFVRSTF